MEELIIDFSWLWNRSYFAFKDLKTASGDLTGAMFGILKFHEQIAQKGYRIVACLDDVPTRRKQLYEGYKANREIEEDRYKAKRCNQALFEILSFLGWTFYKTEGYEADDLIASRACQYAKQGKPCTIFSSDKDLLQLLELPTVKITSSIDSGKFVYKTDKYILDKIGCRADLVRYFRPLKGDSSDNIPIATLRVKTTILVPFAEAIKDSLVLGLTLPDAYDRALTLLESKVKLTPKAKETLTNGKNQYVLNFQLMDLLKWYNEEPLCSEQPVSFRQLDEKVLFDLLDRYELKDFKGCYLDSKMMGDFKWQMN